MAPLTDVMQSKSPQRFDRQVSMRISTMIRFTPYDDPQDRLLYRVADYARRIEAAGFPGIWVGDLLGRGRPTLDPLVELAVLSAVTSKAELGIGVLQLPLRHPIELAHRVQSVQALSGNRLVLAVGSGSTKDDFDLLGYDYDKRFGMLRSHLRSMQGDLARRVGAVYLAGLRGLVHQSSPAPGAAIAGLRLRQKITRLDAIGPLQ